MDLISDSWWSDEINSYNWLMDEGPEEMIAKSFDSWETRGLEYQNIWIVERREEWSGWRDEGTCLFLLFVCWVRDSCLSCCCLFPEWVSEWERANAGSSVHGFINSPIYSTNIWTLPQIHAIVDSNKLQGQFFKFKFKIRRPLLSSKLLHVFSVHSDWSALTWETRVQIPAIEFVYF